MPSPAICAQFTPVPVSPETTGFVLPPKKTPVGFEPLSAIPKLAGISPASRLEVRPAPEIVSSGIPEMDELSGGLPRGCMTEICGPASSGRTSILLATLAAATRRNEACALVDVSDALDPLSAAAAGMDFKRLLWVRCGTANSPHRHRKDSEAKSKEGPVEQALRATDLLLQSGGFGVVAIDLGDVPLKEARRIPLASWFRFERAVERTPTVLFVVAQEPLAQTCASLLMKVEGNKPPDSSRFSIWAGENTCPSTKPSHARLLDRLQIKSELLRSRGERKPARAIVASFAAKAIRAG